MSLPRYAEYKDSGVAWLGDVPAQWNVSKIKTVIKAIDSGVSVNAVDTPAGDESVGVLKTSCVYDGTFRFEENKAVLEEELSRVACAVEIDTVIVSRMNTPALVGAAGLVKESRPNIYLPDRLWQIHFQNCAPSFVHYWTLSPIYRYQVEIACAGTSSSMQNLGQDQFKSFWIPLPTVDEQSAIATFLDREIGKIDALIAEQEKLLTLLAEKRQATISHAVTRGLNPNAPMKDSGVPWLGEVPAHWKVVRIKDVARLESGHTPSKQVPEYWEDCDIPWVSLNDSKQLAVVDYISETAFKINAAGLENSSARMLPPGTVVFTRDATIGLAAITTTDMAVSQHLIAWCPSPRIDSLYLLRVFNFLKPHLDSLTFGATIKTIGMGDVKRLVTPLPPVEEQREIVQHVAVETAKLDELRHCAEHAIVLLKERRSALIAAAVTGKIDVRGSVEALVA